MKRPIVCTLPFFLLACAGTSDPPGGSRPTPSGGSGGVDAGPVAGGAGGWGGSGGGSGGASGGTGGNSGGIGGSGEIDGGTAGRDASGAVPDAPPARDGGAIDAGAGGTGGSPSPPGPTTPGQGPSAEGRIVYSQDFEQDMTGITRSPVNLPIDRAVVVDDPVGQRGKVMKVEWRAGDNFRTSAGTEPRSWISNRAGNEFRPGQKMSHAFGFMTTSTAMNHAFAQVISSNGPVWMLVGDGDGTLAVFCNPCGGNTRHLKLEPNRWYDFRVEIDYKVGGQILFYVDGQLTTMRTIASTRGTIAHWDGGIYNRPAGTASNRTRTVYISNLSVGEK